MHISLCKTSPLKLRCPLHGEAVLFFFFCGLEVGKLLWDGCSASPSASLRNREGRDHFSVRVAVLNLSQPQLLQLGSPVVSPHLCLEIIIYFHSTFSRQGVCVIWAQVIYSALHLKENQFHYFPLPSYWRHDAVLMQAFLPVGSKLQGTCCRWISLKTWGSIKLNRVQGVEHLKECERKTRKKISQQLPFNWKVLKAILLKRPCYFNEGLVAITIFKILSTFYVFIKIASWQSWLSYQLCLKTILNATL